MNKDEATSSVPPARAIALAHERLRISMRQAMAASEGAFPACYAALLACVEEDFRREEELMETVHFPSLKAHREAHARVLAALHRVHGQVDAGHAGAGRHALGLLATWFAEHEVGMDAALLHAISSCGAVRMADRAN